MTGRRRTPHIEEGQIWRARGEPSLERFVRVIMVIYPDSVLVRTCRANGVFARGSRRTQVQRKRFAEKFDCVSVMPRFK